MNKFMKEALKEAKKAEEKMEVPIGAIIVKNGKIIARAHNLREKKQNALAHAEVLCIEKACRKLKSWRLDECELYVTLEPCCMCVGSIIQSRIKKIYIGSMDSKNGCVGSICNILEDIKTTHKVEYEYMLQEECSNILTEFFRKLRKIKSIK